MTRLRLAGPGQNLWSVPGVRAGLLGSGLLLASGWGAAPISAPLNGSSPLAGVPLLGWVRTTHLGDALSSVLFFTGLVALLLGWIRLGRGLQAGDRQVRDLWRIGALWSAPLLLAPPLASRDVYSYLAQGHLAALGLDPYTYGPSTKPGGLLDAVGQTWWYTPSPYGPAFTTLSSWVSQLTGGGLLSGFVLMRLLAVLGVVACAVVTRRVAVVVGADPAVATWLAVLNPLVLLHLVAGAHSEAVLLPLVVAAIGLAVARRPVWAAVVLGLAAAVKVTVIVALPFLAVLWLMQRPQRPARLLACAGGLAALTLAVVSAVSLASGFGFGWIAGARVSALHGSRLSVTTTLSDAAHFTGVLLGQESVGLQIGASVRLLGLLLAAVIVLRLLKPGADLQRVVLRCGAALCVVALLAPIAQPWYLLPGLAVVAVARPGPRAQAFAVRLTVLFALLLRPAGGEVLHLYTPFPLLCAGLSLAAVLILAARHDRAALTGPSAPHTLKISAPVDL